METVLHCLGLCGEHHHPSIINILPLVEQSLYNVRAFVHVLNNTWYTLKSNLY